MVTGRRYLRAWLGLMLSVLLVLVAGCASLERLPAVPEAETKQATFLGIANARFVIDDGREPLLLAEYRQAYERERAYATRNGRPGPLPAAYYLALSGGSDNGAFGAGLLTGWTEAGTRPSFKAVTGVSTGALSAPFAFLGPAYDQPLGRVYTDVDLGDIMKRKPLLIAAASEDSLTDSTPLYNLISSYVDDALIDAIAAEYDKGRLLLIGTTNLDAGRAVIWNIGAIARSGHPQARESIRRILLASASIPGVFPPVMFDIELGGQHFQEMHGDGGTVNQAFLYPPNISARLAGVTAIARPRAAYIVRNGKALEDWKETERKTLAIAGRAVSTLIASNGVGDIYRLYATTKRDGVAFNLALIEDDFTEPYKGPFNRTYMQSLFDYGRLKAKAGYPWRKVPPGFAPT